MTEFTLSDARALLMKHGTEIQHIKDDVKPLWDAKHAADRRYASSQGAKGALVLVASAVGSILTLILSKVLDVLL